MNKLKYGNIAVGAPGSDARRIAIREDALLEAMALLMEWEDLDVLKAAVRETLPARTNELILHIACVVNERGSLAAPKSTAERKALTRTPHKP